MLYESHEQLWLHYIHMHAIPCSLQWGFSVAGNRHSSSGGHGRGSLHNICSLFSSVSPHLYTMWCDVSYNSCCTLVIGLRISTIG